MQDGGPTVLLPRKAKKSFTERLSTRFDRLTSATSSSRQKGNNNNSNYNRAYQEVYRDHYGNLLLPRVASLSGNSGGGGGGGAIFSSHPDPWTSAHPSAVSPQPRRTFHNVIPRSGGRGPASSGNSAAAWSGWDRGVRYSAAPPHPHSHATAVPSTLNDQVLYGEVLYGEAFPPFAINSNVCLCEDYLGGTQRAAGRRSGGGSGGGGGGSANKATKRCKKCGYDRPGVGVNRGLRRSASEESVNGHYTDPYEYTSRRQLQQQRSLMGQKPVFYDEQDEYDDLGRMQ